MDCVPELVQPPPMTVPDAPRSPLAQTNGPEPTSRFVATGSDCAPPRSAGSADVPFKPMMSIVFNVPGLARAPVALKLAKLNLISLAVTTWSPRQAAVGVAHALIMSCHGMSPRIVIFTQAPTTEVPRLLV